MSQPATKLPPDGDYVVMRATDTPDSRASATTQLYDNGCKRIRFATLPDGRLHAHGYLRERA